MPKITNHHTIEITPERFLEQCSPVELQEVELLIQSPRFQQKINQPQADQRPVPASYPDVDEVIDPIFLTCH